MDMSVSFEFEMNNILQYSYFITQSHEVEHELLTTVMKVFLQISAKVHQTTDQKVVLLLSIGFSCSASRF